VVVHTAAAAAQEETAAGEGLEVDALSQAGTEVEQVEAGSVMEDTEADPGWAEEGWGMVVGTVAGATVALEGSAAAVEMAVAGQSPEETVEERVAVELVAAMAEQPVEQPVQALGLQVETVGVVEEGLEEAAGMAVAEQSPEEMVEEQGAGELVEVDLAVAVDLAADWVVQMVVAVMVAAAVEQATAVVVGSEVDDQHLVGMEEEPVEVEMEMAEEMEEEQMEEEMEAEVEMEEVHMVEAVEAVEVMVVEEEMEAAAQSLVDTVAQPEVVDSAVVR